MGEIIFEVLKWRKFIPINVFSLSKDEQEAFNIVAGIQDGPQRNVLYQVVQIVLLQEELQEK